MKKLATLLLLVGGLAGWSKAEDLRIDDLSKGMYSYPSANKIPDNSAALIQNFYTDIEPVAVERGGSEKRDTTVLGATKSVTGLWEFRDTSGNLWIISYSSRTFYKNIAGATPAAFGPAITVNTIPDCTTNLGKFWCTNGTDPGWSFDGTSTASVAGMPLGTLIEPWRTRLVVGNITGAQSTLRFSADGDGTSWSLGVNATDPFSLQIGGANDGQPISCLYWSYLDNLAVGRKRDLWYVSGFDLADVETRNVSSEIGCIQQGSMREFDGSLMFMSNRGLEEAKGYTITNVSEPIRNITDQIVKNTASERSITQTSQADFEAGISSPTGYISTTYLPGTIHIATAAALDPFDDLTGPDFAAGTLTTLSTETNTSALTLSYQSTATFAQQASGSTAEGLQAGTLCATDMYQTFTAADNYVATAVDVSISRDSSYAGNATVRVCAGDAGCASGSSGIIPNASIPTSQTTVRVVLDSPVRISNGAVYSVNVGADLGSVAGSRLNWYYTTGASSNVATKTTAHACPGFCICGSTIYEAERVTSRTYRYAVLGRQFQPSGSIVSQTFDMGITTYAYVWNWGVMVASGSIPTLSSATFETQTSPDGVTWDALVACSTNAPNLIQSLVRRYIRYKIILYSGLDASTSPVITDVLLYSSERRQPAGYFVSSVMDSGSTISAYQPVFITDSKSGGTISYQFNCSTETTTTRFNASSWTSIVSGGIPTNAVQRYSAYRASFTITSGTASVYMGDFKLSWTEGGVSQPIVSQVYDRRYWLAYTTSTAGGATNDRVLIYQRNHTWTIFAGINAASFALWRDSLYFGNSNNTGYVYKFDTGNSDDGTTITSSIVSKSYDMNLFYRDKDFRRSYLSYMGDSGHTGSYSLEYFVDQSTTAYSLGSASLGSDLGQIVEKHPFSFANGPLQGREIQFRLSKSTTGNRLKLSNFILDYGIMEPR